MRLRQALGGEPLQRPPIWFMRQAGRYLPEYRELRTRYSFLEAMSNSKLAAEITLQPLRRFPLDAAIVFSDIMTPLGAMGVQVDFDPGPRLQPLDLEGVLTLKKLDLSRLDFLHETISRVRRELADDVAVIGFAAAPTTLLAYLLEGGGSQQFPRLRKALHHETVGEALSVLASAMNSYLKMQAEAGADVVQLFDSWAGLLSVTQFEQLAAPSARASLSGLPIPTIYFAPGASHLYERFPQVGAVAYGVDWRISLDESWRRLGVEHPIQGNLDPAVLLAAPERVIEATTRVLEEARGRPGHTFGLGHGILPDTPLAGVEAMVRTVLEWRASPADLEVAR